MKTTAEYSRDWKAKNPERRKEIDAKCRENIRWRRRDSQYRIKLGVTLDWVLAKFNSQAGRCEICGEPVVFIGNTEWRWEGMALDHCHDTGTIRGILCQSCNNGIARFQDSPELLRKAADYLESYE